MVYMYYKKRILYIYRQDSKPKSSSFLITCRCVLLKNNQIQHSVEVSDIIRGIILEILYKSPRLIQKVDCRNLSHVTNK